MALIGSHKQGDEIVCGCSCLDVYGTPISIITSGLDPCICILLPAGYWTLSFDLGDNPNGAFDCEWNDAFGIWVGNLGEGTRRIYTAPDCSGLPTTEDTFAINIGIRCRLDLGYGLFDVFGQITASGAFGDPLPNDGECGHENGPSDYQLINNGTITILPPV